MSGAANSHWPHAPVHRLAESGTYFVTVGTYLKKQHFMGAERLDVLERGLCKLLSEAGWRLEAWAVFPNHYHFVAGSPESCANAQTMRRILAKLHEKTAKWVNKLDKQSGRKVWHNYRETLLTYEKSYLSRLNYTHQNAVHHGIVPVANQYRWCSARWFESTATNAQIATIYSLKTNRIKVDDDFEVKL